MLTNPVSKRITDKDNNIDIAVAGNVTVYSKSFPLIYAEYFGIRVKATSSGTVDLKIETEHSVRKPASEGYADAEYIKPQNFQDITISNTNLYLNTFSPYVFPYIRFKIIGGATNDASTTVQITINVQENV